MKCECMIDACADYVEGHSEGEIRVATGAERCAECGRRIMPGEAFGHDTCDEQEKVVTVYHTCLDCLSVREAFFCTWYFTMIWESLEEDLRDTIPFGNFPCSCIAKLTPLAREKVCEIIEEIWRASEDEEADDETGKRLEVRG